MIKRKGTRMKTLNIDIETYSSADLNRTGVYRYCESADFEILLFGYAVDGGEVHVIDVAQGETIPDEIIRAISDPCVIINAFNANFERVCLSRWLKRQGYPLNSHTDSALETLSDTFLNPTSWRCTMVWSAYLGLPLSLENAGIVLGLDQQKLRVGKDLIRYFCKPCVPTLANGMRTRNLPVDDPEKWAQFIRYNKRDVAAEMEIQQRLAKYPVPDEVWAQYHLDQEINDRGILVDRVLVKSAMQMDTLSRSALTDRLRAFTNLDNPSSLQQMKRWLSQNGMEVESLSKNQVSALLNGAPVPLKNVLILRQQLAKSSIKKYAAMASAVCEDGRLHGCFQFYGANRTGRFSGRLVQLQNLPQNHLPNLENARALVRAGNYEGVRTCYDSVPDVLSELIRTAFIAPEGKLLYVADFSAIEARVLAWLAGETWRSAVFQNGGDIYCASASAMFHVPVEKHGVNGQLRQKGKIAELALGYGGSVGALKAMDAADMGLSEDELLPLVKAWRAANPYIVQFWWDVDKAAATAVRDRTATETHGIRFICKGAMLFIELPSGRRLAYVKPGFGTSRFGSSVLTYFGVGSTKKWERLETYGPKLCENITQAISRDVLCYAMQTLRQERIVAHVHDELIIEADPSASLPSICERMSKTPPWAKGLILRADGFVTPFYRKD